VTSDDWSSVVEDIRLFKNCSHFLLLLLRLLAGYLSSCKIAAAWQDREAWYSDGRIDGQSCMREGVAAPVSHYWIAAQKSPPADNLPTKIRPARRPPGWDGYLPVNCRPGGDFPGKRRSYNRERFFIHINSVVVFPRVDFSWGRHFNVYAGGVVWGFVRLSVRRIGWAHVRLASTQRQSPAEINHAVIWSRQRHHWTWTVGGRDRRVNWSGRSAITRVEAQLYSTASIHAAAAAFCRHPLQSSPLVLGSASTTYSDASVTAFWWEIDAISKHDNFSYTVV